MRQNEFPVLVEKMSENGNQTCKNFFFSSGTNFTEISGTIFRSDFFRSNGKTVKGRLFVDGIISPSPNSKIEDLFNIFKKGDGFLHLSLS